MEQQFLLLLKLFYRKSVSSVGVVVTAQCSQLDCSHFPPPAKCTDILLAALSKGPNSNSVMATIFDVSDVVLEESVNEEKKKKGKTKVLVW